MFGHNETNKNDDDSTMQSAPLPPSPSDNSSPKFDMTGRGASDAPADTDTNSAADSSPSNDNLLSIKQQALQSLTPLVGHLDQTPEEKFRTTMMMIQAADNQALIPVAYEAANAISDEKAKAQALLDIVNEINYFTQQQNS